jgi:hypothetical protein
MPWHCVEKMCCAIALLGWNSMPAMAEDRGVILPCPDIQEVYREVAQ